MVYHNLRKWDEAIADYTVAITKDPNNVMALRKRADTYVAMAQFQKALPDLEAALKIKPDDPDILQNLQYVQAKAAPPRVVTAPVATPVPPAPPEGMTMPMKIGLGIGGLFVIGVIAFLVAKRKS